MSNIQESVTVKHAGGQLGGRVNLTAAPEGKTVSELALELAELRHMPGELGRVQYQLCVDPQGRVCANSQNRVSFVVDYTTKKPQPEQPEQPKAG
jgi:hypothetical protein